MSEDPRAVWLSTVIASGMAEKGWVQRDLANQLGVSQSAVSKWIRGKGGIEVEQAIRLALVLDHNVLEFVGTLWPEIAAADPVPSDIRELLSRASPAQLRRIRSDIEAVLGEPAAPRESAGQRAVRTGRRRPARPDAERRRSGEGHR